MKKTTLGVAFAALLIATGANAQVASMLTQPLQVAATQKDGITHDVYTKDGMIMVVTTRGTAAVPVGDATMQNVHMLCERGGKLALAIGDGVPVINKSGRVYVNGMDSGYDCPMPEAVGPYAGHVQDSWAMHRGHGVGEFTDEHLRSVLTEMRNHPMGEFITRLDIPRGYYGNDREYIDRALEKSVTGQLQGWKVTADGVFYLVVMNNCLDICTGPAVTWHLHKPQPKPQPKKKVVVKKPRPNPAVIPMRCSRGC